MQDTVQTLPYQEFLFVFLGSTDDKAIVLNSDRMKSLEKTIDELSKQSLDNIRGIIFTSPPSLAFCVGADINAIKGVKNINEGKQLAEQGQRIFSKIEALSKPTFAAIQGHCVGGGCELALACNYRLIANDDKSKIGLPETKLGILPGFGGTQRLPKVIGLPSALDFITNAKVVSAKTAYKLGLVDAFIETEAGLITNDKIVEVCKKTLENKPATRVSLTDRILSNTSIGRKIVESKAQKMAFAKTKGKYPAIPLAIKSTLNAYLPDRKSGYQKEAEFLGTLIASPECKSLVHLFFLTEFASKIGKKSDSKLQTSHLGIIGAGVMGKGIAAIAIKNGLKVSVSDTNPISLTELREHSRNFIFESKSLNESAKNSLLANLTITTNNPDLRICDTVIEAATENLEVKKKIFASLTDAENQISVLATNTSSLMLSSIYSDVSAKEKCVGIHFFNPVEKMPLIEIVRDKTTSDQTALRACALASKLGKYPVIVEDVPGFLVNRILSPYLAEASNLLADGAGLLDIENVIQEFGFPMGPFRLLDEVGLDIASKVQEVLTNGYGERMRGSGFIDQVLQKGLLGKKAGKGFYLFSGDKPSLNFDLLNELKIEISSSKISKEEILERLLTAMTLEALRALEEGVAGKMGDEAIGQVDLASVMGFGFPPFRGGILFHAKNEVTFKKLDKLAKKYQSKGKRFNKPAILKSLL